MAFDKCNDAIISAVGRDLDDRERRIVLARAGELKNRIDLANSPTATEDVLKQFSDEVKFNRVLQRRNTALNYAAFAKAEAWRKNVDFVTKNPAEGFRAFMRGDLRNFEGSKKSLASLVQRESNARTGGMLADLEKARLKDYAFSGKDDLNITKAWSDIKNGVEADPAKYGKNAVDVAMILDKHLEVLRQDQNQAGAWIGRAADRLFRRSHDAGKIAQAGDNKYGSTVGGARDAWVKFISDRMDWEKSFGGDLHEATDNVKNAALGEMWHDFKNNDHYKPGEAIPPVGLGSRNIAKKLSHGRQIIFNRPEDELAYFKQFGTGTSVAENVFHNLSGGGRDLAMMRKLGPNPEATILKIKQSWMDDLKNQGSDMDDAREDFEKVSQDEMDNTWRLLTEGNGHPAENFVGRFAAAVRGVTNTAALGSSVFSLPGDLALRARSIHQMTGESFGKHLLQATKDMFSGTGISKAERQQLFAELGLRTEGVNMPLDPNDADTAGFGRIAKFNQQVMGLTGHAWWDNKFRLNALVADGYRHWTQRGLEFEQLSKAQQNSFKQFGIDKAGWDVIRQSDGTKLGNNQNVFMPSDIDRMPLGAFKELTGASKPTDAQLARARDTLKDNYRNYMGELSDRSTSSPSIANKAVMGMGYKGREEGTVAGELYRGAFQLKGWAINYMRNHLGAELMGYDNQPKTWGEAMKATLTGGNNKGLMGIAKLVSSGVVIASATNMMRDMAAGKTPSDPTSLRSIGRAFARQSFGVYSDFLLQDARPDASFWDRVGSTLGPEYGLTADIFDAANKFGNQVASQQGVTPERLGADERDWFQDVYRRTPGTSLFWAKGAMDYAILNNISEALNPGYQQRLMDSAAKKNQSYMLGGAGPQTTP